jgi:hypothetical protein
LDDNAMAALGFLFFLSVVFALGFGPTRLLLKGSRFEQYTVEATYLFTPMLASLVFSLAGYVRPDSLSALEAWLFMLAGTAVSIYFAVKDWRFLSELFSSNGRRILLVLGSAALAAMVMILYFPGNLWKEFFLCGNGEYVNYAHLAALLTGHCHPTSEFALSPFFQYHHTIRYGQDIQTALTALLSGKHPLNVVLPLSVFYRFEYTVALGLVFHRMAKGSGRLGLVPFLLLFDGFLLVETFSFTTSFMSSNCTLSLFVIYVVLLLTCERFGWREILLLVLANCYFLITYPEFLAIIKLFELAHVACWVVKPQARRWQPVFVTNVLVCMLHPLLVVQKIGVVLAQFSCNNGWDIFGNLAKKPITYLSHCLGLRYAHVPEACSLFPPWLVIVLAILVGGTVLAGLCALGRQYHLQHATVIWAAMFFVFHLIPLICPAHHSYGAVKFGTQTFFVPLAAILALTYSTIGFLRRWTYGVVTLWAASAAIATIAVYQNVSKVGTRFDYASIREVLACSCPAKCKVAALVPLSDLSILYLAVNETGHPFVPLSEGQREYLLRLNEDVKVLRTPNRSDQPPQRVAFEGVLLVKPDQCNEQRIPLDNCAFQFYPDQEMAVIAEACLFHGRLRYCSRVDFPGGHWITANPDWNAKLFTPGNRVELRGNLPAFSCFVFPYRFQVGIKHTDWSSEVVVAAPGPFKTMLHLPPRVAGSVVELTFRPGQTVRATLLFPDSRDCRQLGFLVYSLVAKHPNSLRPPKGRFLSQGPKIVSRHHAPRALAFWHRPN